MDDTLTIKIDPALKKALIHKCQVLREDVDTIVSRLLELFINQPDITQDVLLQLPGIKQFLDIYHSKEDEPFFAGLTVDQYFALSEEEREELWDKLYRQEFDRLTKETERELSPNVTPPRQRRAQKKR